MLKLNYRSILLLIIVGLAVVVAGWTLVAVGSAFQAPPSDFVALPTTPLSKSGAVVIFSDLSTIMQQNRAVGARGYLVAGSGSPVAGVKIFVTYYFEGSYRTQSAVTNDKGYFELMFPLNWTGWFSMTFTYFGDSDHRGLVQAASLSGENLTVDATVQ